MSDQTSSVHSSRELYLRLLQHVRPHWRIFLLAILAMVVLAATEPAFPALLKPMLDGSFVDKDPDAIIWVPILLVLLFLVRGVSDFASKVGLAWVANRLVMDLRQGMFERLMQVPARFYDDNATGVVLSKLTFDVTQVTTAATSALTVLIKDSLAVLGLLGYMLYVDWRLTLIALLPAPFILLVVRVISRRLRLMSRALQKSMGEMTSVLEEAIQGNKVVRIFGGQDYEKGRFAEVTNQARRFQMKFITAGAASGPVVQLFIAVALAIIVYLAALDSAKGGITVGDFVSFFTAMAMLFSPLKRLTSVNEQLQKGLAAAESVFALMDQEPERDTGQAQLDRVRGHLQIQNLGFRYAQARDMALQDINFEVRPGETVALVGPSGSGKTSLVSLLPRLYGASEGRILLDGEDIAGLRLAELRGHISLVSQEVVLFNDSVAANIAYGPLREAGRENIRSAAQAAHALEFIEQMPEGFDTLIGENGVRLSGGQRQRLAIARAFLKDAPILILDEATSALDSASERHIQAALEALRRGRTTLVIAHRLSTIESADRIVVLDQGRIAESGSHTELLAAEGIYAGLYRIQYAQEAGAD